MNFKNRIICLLTTLTTTLTVFSGPLKVISEEVFAATSSIEYGDVNNDTIVDVFDLIAVRDAISNGKSIGENILIGQYAWELRQYLLGESDEFLYEKVHDSDNDNLSDWEENNTYGTDFQVPDTDEDSISDGYEVLILGTDPLTPNDFQNTDSDGDGLSDAEEYEFGTETLIEDTDDDDLSDYDELYTYNTDPINPDTDGDDITDGDEIKLGLDPNNPGTNGYPDNEYMTVQYIPYDHEILSEINTEDSPYKLSIEITAAGLAESNLEVMHSGYSYAMCNSSTLGSAPELSYNENFKVENIKLKFEIADDYIDNLVRLDEEKTEDLTGINRLCIFKYFEDIDMLLPIQTEYEGTNVVYATIDAFEKDENGNSYGIGSYCLIDMEMWTDNLTGAYNDQQGIEEIYSEEETDETTEESVDAATTSDLTEIGNTKSASSGSFTITKNLVKTIRTNLAAINNGQISVKYWNYCGHKYALFENTGLSWETANAICKSMGGHLMTVTTESELGFLQDYLSANAKNSFYWIGAKNNGSWSNWVTGESMDFVKTIRVSGYGLSSFSYDRLYYAVGMAYTKSFSNASCGYICEWEPGRAIRDPEQSETYFLLLPNGTKNVCLDSKLSANNDTDTDGDGISDYDEINFNAIKKISGTNTVNLKQCFEYTSKLGFNLSDEFIASKMSSSNGTQYASEMLEQTIVYPISSDPTDPDTDGDYYLDKVDSDALKWNKMVVPDSLLDDSNSINGKNPSTNVDPKVSDGTIAEIQIEGGAVKNQITFNRSTMNKNSSRCQFVLTPEDSSDYIITVTDVNITAAVNSSKFLTVNNKAEQYATPYFDAANGSITYYYSLKGGKNYTISITNTAAASDFTVTISQDNWVYAPNGGVRDGVQNKYSGVYKTETYFTGDTILVQEQMDELNGESYGSETLDEFLNKSPQQLKHITETQVVDLLMESFELGYNNANDIMSIVGDFNTGTGIILTIIPGTDLIGGILTIVDNVMYGASIYNNIKFKELETALLEGKYNICIDAYVNTFAPDSNETDAWNEQHYINKYYELYSSYGYTTKLHRASKILLFDMNEQVVKKSDNGWELYYETENE